jgi:cell division protein FtsL
METLPIDNGYGMRQQLTGVIQNKMEMFIYIVGAITAVIGVIVYMIYTQVETMDQHVWQQNNALKQKISILESELASLTSELKELKAKEIEEVEEE